MVSRPGRAIQKALKMVLVASLLTLALTGSARKIKERYVSVACYVAK